MLAHVDALEPEDAGPILTNLDMGDAGKPNSGFDLALIDDYDPNTGVKRPRGPDGDSLGTAINPGTESLGDGFSVGADDEKPNCVQHRYPSLASPFRAPPTIDLSFAQETSSRTVLAKPGR